MKAGTTRRDSTTPGVMRSVTHGSATIDFELVRSDRRTLGFVVRPDGSVVVRAPRRAREADVLRAVGDHGDWILRTRRRLADAERRRRLSYREGELHLHLGRPYPLEIVRDHVEDVRLTGGRLRVTAPADGGDVPPERVKELLDAWYAGEARRVLPRRLAACWAAFAADGHAPPTLRIKRMRTRWGSMSPKGAMSLRLDLVRAPVECIDYVVFHELCHLERAHHGPEFWALVERLVPDWRRRKRRLERLLG